MAKKHRGDVDSPWKEALHYFLPHFLAFFFPRLHKAIDWKRGYIALDKEFQQIVRDARIGKRLADKLFKVWLTRSCIATRRKKRMPYVTSVERLAKEEGRQEDARRGCATVC